MRVRMSYGSIWSQSNQSPCGQPRFGNVWRGSSSLGMIKSRRSASRYWTCLSSLQKESSWILWQRQVLRRRRRLRASALWLGSIAAWCTCCERSRGLVVGSVCAAVCEGNLLQCWTLSSNYCEAPSHMLPQYCYMNVMKHEIQFYNGALLDSTLILSPFQWRNGGDKNKYVLVKIVFLIFNTWLGGSLFYSDVVIYCI